jgi:hypothetical protein
MKNLKEEPNKSYVASQLNQKKEKLWPAKGMQGVPVGRGSLECKGSDSYSNYKVGSINNLNAADKNYERIDPDLRPSTAPQRKDKIRPGEPIEQAEKDIFVAGNSKKTQDTVGASDLYPIPGHAKGRRHGSRDNEETRPAQHTQSQSQNDMIKEISQNRIMGHNNIGLYNKTYNKYFFPLKNLETTSRVAVAE